MDSKAAQVVVTVPARLKNSWVKSSQAEGKKLTDWIIERVVMTQAQDRDNPSWKQFVSKGFEVPHGATGFHVKDKDGQAVIVFNVNLTEELPDGSRSVSGTGYVEHDITGEQAAFLRDRKWYGSLGWWFWDCDKFGAQRRESAHAPWEVRQL